MENITASALDAELKNINERLIIGIGAQLFRLDRPVFLEPLDYDPFSHDETLFGDLLYLSENLTPTFDIRYFPFIGKASKESVSHLLNEGTLHAQILVQLLGELEKLN